MNCKTCGREMVIEPVPGAVNFPRRLSCPLCGFFSEKRSGLKANSVDPDRPNDYLNELASPADVIEFSEGDPLGSLY